MKRKKKPLFQWTNPIEVLKETGNFIPIMDKDPVQAARCLIYPHVEYALKTITWSIIFAHSLKEEQEILLQDEKIKKYLCFDIVRNNSNLMFYSQMYEELQSIYNTAYGKSFRPFSKFSDKFLYDTSYSGCLKGNLTVRGLEKFIPFNESYRKRYKPYIYQGYNAVNGYRRMYLKERYTYDKFPVGAPQWYNPMKRIIFQRYDLTSRKHVRITTDEQGNYKYYVAYISDRWVEIENVPKEMRDVIDAFLIGRKTDAEF